MKQLANRTKELQQFTRMVTGQCEERIFLIEAPSGCGKTSLLLRFEAECPHPVKSAWVDLKAAQTGAPYVFSRIRKKLGTHNFPRFDRAVQHFMAGGVEVSGNEIQGQENQIQVILNVQDENLRDLRLVALREAFFEDLNSLSHPVLLILDTFNAAPGSLATWIAGGFLAEVADAPNVFAVVAGQQVPEISGEWLRYHYYSQLDAITEIEAWWNYAQASNLPFNRDEIGMAIRILKGQPSEIVKTFEALAKEAGA